MLRAARLTDLPSIASLYHSVWHETHAALAPEAERCQRTLEYFINRLTPLLPTTWIDERNEALVGFVSWHGSRLGQLYVSTAYRGSTVARDLLSAAECAMAENGVIRAELHCVVDNHRARRFYEKHGWTISTTIMTPLSGAAGPVPIQLWRMEKQLSP